MTKDLRDWLAGGSDDFRQLNAEAVDAFADINRDLFGPPADEDSEHAAQVAVFAWAAANTDRLPELALLYAIPNGGARHRAVAAKLKAEGVKAGVPDMALPVARGPYIGAFLEMKHGRNKPTSAQLEWLDALGNQGHFCAVCYTAREAERLLEWYLGLVDGDSTLPPPF